MLWPPLPFGLTYPAVGVFLLGALVAGTGAVLQQVFADQISELFSGWRRRAAARRRGIRRDEWDRYAVWVAGTYRSAKLGFIQDGTVELDAVYVPLQYEHDGRRVDVYRDIQAHLRTVVLGAAGAGKSTILRHSMLQWAVAPQRFERVPVLIELGRYNVGERSVEDLLVATFARVVEAETHPHRRKKRPPLPLVDDAERLVPDALVAGRLCVFLDGLDEVVSDRRGDVAWRIKDFADRYPACQVVVTCRDAVYDNDLVPAFDRTVTVAGFDDAGIRQCLRLWFTRRREAVAGTERDDPLADAPPDPRAQVEQLMAALRASPTLMRLARSPLMLTMIALMHDADPGEGPMLTNSRAEFYEQAVEHLLRRDRDLGRHPELVRYKFAHKRMALRAIALAAQGDLTPGSDHRVITEAEITAVTTRLRPNFQLADTDLPKMVNEIVERSGLLLRLPGPQEAYEFAHLTLQEYLAAVELADEPDRLLALYRENPARWRETVKLWCAGAHREATGLVRLIEAGSVQQTQAGAARDRLLALECIAESRNIDAEFATRIVDRFAGRLGTNFPDRRLVLAALGAVAGNTGPIGEALFDRLGRLARHGGLTCADAVVALAESRRQAALETLSELALDVPAARAALRSTGELAIPVLTRRAADGSVAAVDDLAAIGTPAAAVAIAEQLWRDPDVAVRAAWHLAVLVSAADVEAELDRFDPTRFLRRTAPSFHVPRTQVYEWLWEPFVPMSEPRRGMVTTMGRVGLLIHRSDEQQIPVDLGTVDARIALGLGARPHVFAVANSAIPSSLSSAVLEAGEWAGHRRHTGAVTGALRSEEAVEIFDVVQQTDPDAARSLATSLVNPRLTESTAVERRLVRQLPTPMLAGLATKAWEYRSSGVSGNDWLAVTTQTERPTVLLQIRNYAIGFAVLLGVAAIVVGVARPIGALFGLWAGGPLWPTLVLLLGVVGTVAGFALDGRSTSKIDWIIVAVGGFFLAVISLLVIALPVAAAWVGWPATIAILALTAAVVTVFSVWTERRERALANPYRAILQLDSRVGQPGQTVIARGSSERPSSAGLDAPPSSSGEYAGRHRR